MPEKKNSETGIKANNRYNEKVYDRINIAIPKEKSLSLQKRLPLPAKASTLLLIEPLICSCDNNKGRPHSGFYSP